MNANKTPLVSVVAVSYNHAQWLLETLKSIKNQTLQDFELIYCDDASADGSAQIASDWLRKQTFFTRTIVHRINQGLCKTLNEALHICSGRYIQFISCDDILMPEKFEHQVAVLEAGDRDVAVVHSDAELIDGDGRPIEPSRFSAYYHVDVPPQEPVYDALLQHNQIAAMTALIRRSIFETVGEYDERLGYEDWDMWLRIACEHRFVYSEYVSARYRIHGANLHLNRIDWTEDKYRILRKHINNAQVRHNLHCLVMLAFESHRLSAEVKHDYLKWSQEFPEVCGIRRSLMKWGVPGRMVWLLVRAKDQCLRLLDRHAKITETG